MPSDNVLKTGKVFRSRELAAAALLVLLVFVPALFSIDNSCYWGDDFAAYISQGIAMAEGRLDEQAALNILMHPSPLPSEAVEGGELIYVWGYPLILSIVYALVGFDRLSFSSIVFYKLPSVIALSLLAAVLFFFYRRRFGFRLSFMLALLFCCCSEMFDFLNTIYSDMVFLLFAALCLLLCERYTEGKKSFLGALLLGGCLWYMYEVRLNGIGILICCALAQFYALVSAGRRPGKAKLAMALLPYIFFLILLFLSHFFIAKATPNTSDIGSGMSLAGFIENIKNYSKLICHWFGLLWNSLLINPLYSISRRFLSVSFESFKPLRDVLTAVSLALCAAGIVFEGKGKNFHLSIFVVVYIIFVSTLPYTQGLRYIYPLLPLLLMFAVYVPAKPGLILSKLPKGIYNAASWLLVCVCCIFILYPHASAALHNEKGIRELESISSPSDIYMQNAYSQEACELYSYIQKETPEDSTIAFFAPRALYLNTGRLGLRPGVNGHSIQQADYYIQYLSVGDFPVDRVPDDGFSPIFKNSQFVLYVNERK